MLRVARVVEDAVNPGRMTILIGVVEASRLFIATVIGVREDRPKRGGLVVRGKLRSARDSARPAAGTSQRLPPAFSAVTIFVPDCIQQTLLDCACCISRLVPGGREYLSDEGGTLRPDAGFEVLLD